MPSLILSAPRFPSFALVLRCLRPDFGFGHSLCHSVNLMIGQNMNPYSYRLYEFSKSFYFASIFVLVSFSGYANKFIIRILHFLIFLF